MAPHTTADNNAHDLLGDSLALARTQLASHNARRFMAKRRALQAALIVLAIGLAAAALLIVLA
jgi:hypothetical protein